MLKVTDTGATITLTEQSSRGDGLFWFGSALLIGAVAVAMAMSLLPMRLAIGALALLVIGCFVFNRLRMQRKKSASSIIDSGVLQIKSGMFVRSQLGKNEQIYIQPNEVVSVKDSTLLISKQDGTVKYQVSGFESVKEAQVMQAILQGQQFGKRNANIKMQAN